MDLRGRRLRLAPIVASCLLTPLALAGDPLYPQPISKFPDNLTWFVDPFDANSDGITDFAVAGPQSGGDSVISVFFGAEPMAFGTPVKLPFVATSYIDDLTTADVDGDGDDDVALLDSSGFTLGLSDGQGGFAVETSALALPGAVLAAADMDADGDLDFVVGGSASVPGSYVLFQGASGAYTAGPVLTSDADSRAVGVADLDADGVLDYVLGQAGGGGHVVLVHGTGGGNVSIWNTTAAPGLNDLTLAHIDGDELYDVAWVTEESFGAATQLGQPDGALGPVAPVKLPSTYDIDRVCAGDLDEDGDDDLLFELAGEILQIAQTTDGVATVLPMNPIPDDTDVKGFTLADVDGDGRLDLVGGITGRLHVMRGLDGLDFEMGISSPLPPNTLPVFATGDLNLDGCSDIVLCHGHVARVALGHADGSLGPAKQSQAVVSPGTWYARAVADFDGDGLPDVAGAVQAGDGPDPLAVNVLEGLGDGTLLLAGSKTPTTELVSEAVPTDFDLDGNLDLAAVTPGHLLVMLGSGSGDFTVLSLGLAVAPGDVAVGDVDADGLPDVILPFEPLDRLEVRLGLGGTLGAPTYVPVAEPVSVRAGDFDGDGRADLAVGQHAHGWGTTDITVLRSLPGSWPAVLTDSCGGISYSPTEVVAFADATGDGLPDVIGVNWGQVGVLACDGLGGFAPMSRFRVSYDPPLSLDVNGDGRADVATVHAIDDWTPKNAIRTSLAGHITPWSDVGYGTAGVSGKPRLLGHGDMLPGEPCSIDLIKAAAAAPAVLVAGASPALMALKGGTLVPTPDVVVVLATGASGDLHLQMDWPGGVPSHFDLFLQVWVKDPAAAAGWASSNGLRGVVP